MASEINPVRYWLFCVFLINEIAGLPVAEHGIIMDAGSSSTKIRIYSWTETLNSVPEFREVFYKKVSPGISSFDENLGELQTYIRTICSILKEELPETSLWPVIPVYFFATAGITIYIVAQVNN